MRKYCSIFALSFITAIPAQLLAADRPAPERQVFYGELHLHTSFSFDAFSTQGTRVTPDEALRFAQGQEISYQGKMVKRPDPLDFMAVTDHSEYLGALLPLDDPKSSLSQSEFGKKYQANKQGLLPTMFHLWFSKTPAPPELNLEAAARSSWQKEIDAANANYHPGKFTTFVGYEWTAQVTTGAYNLHRNVIFKDKPASLPFSTLDSQRPEDLWTYLENLRAQGIEALAIPHNGNGSGGLMYDWVNSDGRAIDEQYAQRRALNEPLTELLQNKGQSETIPGLSANDEFANFEVYDYTLLEARNGVKAAPDGSYVRQALGRGLIIKDRVGTNPFKYGFVGATDFHNGLSTSREDGYAGTGPAGIVAQTMLPDAEAAKRILASNPIPGGATGSQYSGGALTGAWAEENTRDSIYNSFRRKETFATSGTRIRVRFFGGWNYASDLLKNKKWVEAAYQAGVPMGGDMPAMPTTAKAPKFVIWATKDPSGANLDRVQVIKVWLADTKYSEYGEKIFDVAVSGGRKIDPVTSKAPLVGSTVDLTAATYNNSIGAAELSAVWTDPEFDPARPAVYYVRALEIPTPRWSTILSAKNKLPLSPDVPATIQERAMTSPIWYTPAGARK